MAQKKTLMTPAPTGRDHLDFDIIACGAGSPGTVVAARLAENGQARVQLTGAGGGDADAGVSYPAQ